MKTAILAAALAAVALTSARADVMDAQAKCRKQAEKVYAEKCEYAHKFGPHAPTEFLRPTLKVTSTPE